LKVLSTKKDDRGNSWPDYSNSKFERRSEALGSDSDIEGLMDQCYDINEYLDTLRKTEEDLVKLVKEEMLFDMISDEYTQLLRKRQMVEEKSDISEDDIDDDIDDSNFEMPDTLTDTITSEPEGSPKNDGEWSDTDSDEELLKELEGI
jgi:hypothetical protein